VRLGGPLELQVQMDGPSAVLGPEVVDAALQR
jgi:hypothetical protein